MYAYGQVGVSLPHFTGSLWNMGHRVSQSELIPGDLVFFHPDVHHMGIYIGGGQFIHAPSTGDVVKISSLADRAGNYTGAVRPY
jgi:cell wall-associated NlpC family hydrolase